MNISPIQEEQDIVYRLRKRAEIRLANKERKSVQEGKPDRAAQMMIDAADEIEKLRKQLKRANEPEDWDGSISSM
jgi:hypothetical protein